MRVRLELYRFQCDKCSRTWEMTDSHMNVEYFCPYCGTVQPTVGLFGQSMPKHTPPTEEPKTPHYDYTDARVIEEPIVKATKEETFEFSEELKGPDVAPPTEATKPPSLMTKAKPKPAKQLSAEDMMTRKVCSDGWWNPVTKKCQGEGRGHAIEENA